MELKPGYKQTEVGAIPEDWEVARIGDIATVEGGYAFSSKKFLRSGKYQVVKMSNLYGGVLDLERSASYLNELGEQNKHYLLHRSEILITLTGTTGKQDYGYSHKINHEQNLLLNQRVGRLIVRETTSPGYVAFQIKTPCFLNQFFDVSKGGTGNQTNVGTRDVAAMHISLPPLPEQRAIAGVLSDVDELIGALDSTLAKKRDLKQATMQQLLTGQTRLPAFSGEWEVKRLGEVGRFAKGKGIKKDEVVAEGAPCIRYGEIYTHHHDYIRQFRSFIPRSIAEQSQRLQKGDLLFAGSGETAEEIGKCVAFLGDEEAYAGGDIVILTPTGHNSMYLGYLMNHASIVEQKARMGQGDAVVHVSARHLAQLNVRLPKDPEQTAIAKVLSDMDAELAVLEQRRDKTRALKQGMMQELLTGRTRLV